MSRQQSSTLFDLGEDEVVRRIAHLLPSPQRAIRGIGDDCAIWPAPGKGRVTLLKTDCVVEGVHFLPSAAPRAVGWKALCRAVSDIAAMGGTPGAALITLGAPGDTPWKRVAGIYKGITQAAAAYGCEVVGGETTSVPVGSPLFINVSLTGEVEPGCALTRSGGYPGDALLVTGVLGGTLRGWHLKFTPRLAEAQWLARNFRPTAMMDLSDGLAVDLPRLAQASGVSFELMANRIPRRAGVSLEAALGDGEDYELLFSVPEKMVEKLLHAWKQQSWSTRLSHIGFLRKPGLPSAKLRGGWEHFPGN